MPFIRLSLFLESICFNRRENYAYKMSLIDYYESSKSDFEQKTINQIVSFAGDDGKLIDGGSSQKELRKIFRLIQTQKIVEYSRYCLDKPFDDSGLVLQDLVNEIGRRLGFTVTDGFYQGSTKKNGVDGIWVNKEGFSILVETKVTAKFPINLDTTDGYRKKLMLTNENSSILYVVGRNDTISLERQIRGSEYSCTTRILGLEALIKLLEVYEESISEELSSKISEILKPIEYTKVDGIIDIVFATSTDQQFSRELDTKPEETNAANLTKNEEYARKRSAISSSLSQHIGNMPDLIKRKTALFSDASDDYRIAISLSKKYERKDQTYWYAYLEPMRNFLEVAKISFMVYGMLDKNFAIAIPYKVIEEYKNKMNTTPAKNNRSEYWHVSFREENNQIKLILPKSGELISLEEFKFGIR